MKVEGAQPGVGGLGRTMPSISCFKVISGDFFLFPSLLAYCYLHRAELPKLKLSTCPILSEKESARGVWRSQGSGGAQIMNG